MRAAPVRMGLEREKRRARGIHAVIVVATLAGTAMNFMHINPIRALFGTAVINGVIAVPILAAIMLLAARRGVMGDFVTSRLLQAMSWLTTLVMAACVVAMLAL